MSFIVKISRMVCGSRLMSRHTNPWPRGIPSAISSACAARQALAAIENRMQGAGDAHLFADGGDEEHHGPDTTRAVAVRILGKHPRVFALCQTVEL